jgi:hypothetical protein
VRSNQLRARRKSAASADRSLQVLKNSEGQKVPQASFRTRGESDWKTLTTDDIFNLK